MASESKTPLRCSACGRTAPAGRLVAGLKHHDGGTWVPVPAEAEAEADEVTLTDSAMLDALDGYLGLRLIDGGAAMPQPTDRPIRERIADAVSRLSASTPT